MERPNGPLRGERPLELVEGGSHLGCRLACSAVLTRTRLATLPSGVARQRPQAGQGGDGRASVAVAGRQTHEEAVHASHHLGGYVETARLQSLAPAGAARLGSARTRSQRATLRDSADASHQTQLPKKFCIGAWI